MTLTVVEHWSVSHLPRQALWRLRTTAGGSGAGTGTEDVKAHATASETSVWPPAPSNGSDTWGTFNGKHFLAIVKRFFFICALYLCFHGTGRDSRASRILTGHLQPGPRSAQEVSYPFQSSSLSLWNWTHFKMLIITDVTPAEKSCINQHVFHVGPTELVQLV